MKNKDGNPCIYIIQNIINNKVYIGSAIGHYRRKSQHYYMLRRNIHFNKHLQSSWNKYKEENFIFKVIEFIKDLNSITIREEFYIKEYDSTNPFKGFNHRAICDTNLGNKWPEESKLKFSNSKKGKRILHLDYNKLAEINRKKVVAINKITNKQLIFNSIKEASETLDIDRTNISKALHKVIKSAGNYFWNFTEQSVSNNSVNSGNIQIMDNPDPNSVNDIKVTEKEQRLTSEESTNNLDTSAEQPYHWINYEEWKTLKEWYNSSPLNHF
jgi:hypothetical protein